MINVENITVGYDDTIILRELSFEITRGEIFAILGGSGSGKSTLMKSMVGLLEPLSGRIEIEGVGRAGRRGSAPGFGVLFQSAALFGSMSLVDNVRLPLEKWTSLDEETIDAIACSKLRLVGLDGFEDYLPAQLSGGMRKRAGIARALALEPELLFLDEPSAGLDPVMAADLDELILTLNQSLDVTMVMVTHELESIFKVATRCIMLDREEQGIIATGNPRELRDSGEDPRVQRFFHRRGSLPGEARYAD